MTDPLIEVDVEVVEADLGYGDEDVLHGGVETLHDGEVEQAQPPRIRVHPAVNSSASLPIASRDCVDNSGRDTVRRRGRRRNQP